MNRKYTYTTPAYIISPVETMVKGAKQKTWPDPTEYDLIFISFRTFGGTESVSNGILSTIDTANVETWYDPRIKANCRLILADDGSVWEIIGRPEDIDRRHMTLRFKVRSVNGGA